MIKDFIRLMRVNQWYKNLMIFVPLIFSKNLFNADLLSITIQGFVVLCLISSVNYVINDVLDCEKDKLHVKKKNRPVASGKISKQSAIMFALFLAVLSVLIMLLLGNTLFALMATALFASSTLYTLALKNVPIVDIHMISVNFIIRAVSGAFLINVMVSHWLFICVFLLSLFWAVGKRDYEITKAGSEKHREVLKFYTKEMLRAMVNILCAALFVSYVLYASSVSTLMLLTIPFASFMILKYLYFIYSGSEIAQNSEMMFLDKQMLIALVCWVLIAIVSFYVI